MADVFLDGDTVHVSFGPIERIGALRTDLRIPIHQVRRPRVSADPFAAVTGIRAPGTGLPGVIALGTWRSHAHGTSVVAAYRGRPALVFEVEGERVQRVVVSTDEAQQLSRQLSARA